MVTQLPRILSPNLGCPIIVSPEDIQTKGLDIVMAEEDRHSADRFSLLAHPSYIGEGKEFALELKGREELTEGTLPSIFERIEETRFLISTTLRSWIFAGKARFFRYQAKIASPILDEGLRRVGNQPRPTLYDLFLARDGQIVSTTSHALCLRPMEERLRFIHLTDLHIALRNDLYEANLQDTVWYSDPQQAAYTHYNNFNENLRRFIRYANQLADEGKLDFVMITGDLVDFVRHGISEREDYGDNNFQVFRNLILGTGNEAQRLQPNPGLKVPIFTSTGNHDWRFFPYDPAVHFSVFGVNKEVAKQLDLFWADEQGEISRKIDEVYKKLLGGELVIQGRAQFSLLKTPVRGFMQWVQKKVTVSTETIEKYIQKANWQKQLSSFLGTTVIVGFLSKIVGKIPLIGPPLLEWFGLENPIRAGLIVSFLISAGVNFLIGMARRGAWLACENLISIEAGWQALRDYFLTINPYFNYAFRLGDYYFLILDTGHDCMRAEYLWDDGDKKMGPVSIRDNTIGQSPDSMAFYDINEYYPYSQIGWIDRLMQLIKRESKEGDRPARILIGLHAPPANLSQREKQKADRMARNHSQGILLPEGKFEIRYGSVNHYLSQFLHLCLGRTEQDPNSQRYHPIDIVLAGHAHWKLEFRLQWDSKENHPAVYYGDFTGDTNHFQQTFPQLRPFLLQTPAVGPREEYSPEPPYFRRIEIDEKGNITTAEVLALRADGTPFSPNL